MFKRKLTLTGKSMVFGSIALLSLLPLAIFYPFIMPAMAFVVAGVACVPFMAYGVVSDDNFTEPRSSKKHYITQMDYEKYFGESKDTDSTSKNPDKKIKLSRKEVKTLNEERDF